MKEAIGYPIIIIILLIGSYLVYIKINKGYIYIYIYIYIND